MKILPVEKIREADEFTIQNEPIASIFKEVGMIEKYGSGIRRVRLFMMKSFVKFGNSL